MGFLQNVRSKIFGGDVSNLTVQEADVSDELAAAGKAFGTLMEQVGLAVAETQKQLDKNGATIAEEMCKTDVEMIRARETIFGEDGRFADIEIVTGTGKLIELASPVFYEHKFVALQGEFSAREVATSWQTKVKQASVSANASVGRAAGGRGGLLGKKKAAVTGSGSASASASFSDVTVGTTFDSSVGTMRMNALIAPKDSIAIAKPRLILEGPKIEINAQGQITDNDGNRTVGVTIRVTKLVTAADKTTTTVPIGSKPLVIDAGDIDWAVNPATADAKTDANGELKITLKRTRTPGAPPLESKRTAVTVRLGLVTATATVPV